MTESATPVAPIIRYLERADDHSFVEITLDETLVTLRRGFVGKPCITLRIGPGNRTLRDSAIIAKNSLIESGYEVTTKTTPIVPGSDAELVWSEDLPQDAKHKDLIKTCLLWSERTGCNVVRFPDGLIFDGDLDVEWFVDFRLASGLIVHGDIQVNGLFSQNTDSYPNAILINGGIKAKNFIHADSHMKVYGDVRVDQSVYGYYNDGSLTIDGTVWAEVFISYDHDMSANKFRCFYYSDNNPGDDTDWAIKELLDGDEFDFELVEEYVKSNRSLVRSGIK